MTCGNSRGLPMAARHSTPAAPSPQENPTSCGAASELTRSSPDLDGPSGHGKRQLVESGALVFHQVEVAARFRGAASAVPAEQVSHDRGYRWCRAGAAVGGLDEQPDPADQHVLYISAPSEVTA